MSLAIEREAGAGALETFAARAFASRYERAEDIADLERLLVLAEGIGIELDHLRRVSSQIGIGGGLSAATREALELGIFGVPTFVVRPPGREPSLYFGHDRMSLALRAARGDSRLY
jgi:2-hydroxychromene-2-carboxylate isomerase